MRGLLAMTAIAFLAFSILAQTVHAQGMGMGGGRGKRQAQTQDSKQDKPAKADERAYRDALKSIPEKKVDPWGNLR